MEVTFTAAAQRDLGRIHAYIGRENPHAAKRMVDRLEALAAPLGVFPEMGRPVSGGRRELVAPPYILVYRVEAGRVLVLRVWHHAQNRT